MTKTRKLPVGIEDFAQLRKEDFYYVDKTGLIEDLMDNWAKVNLFTRPRRFGKTLNMSMLRRFYEIGADPSLFEGLRIAERRDLCEQYMGKYPVVLVSLKGVDGLTFEEARAMLRMIVRKEAMRHYYLKTSDKVSAENRDLYERMLQMNDEILPDSLRFLCEMLRQHYGQPVVLLIDEYDVPLDKAFQNGYYREMVSLIRSFLGQALKTNDDLYFAVLTGCLRVSKESIFTGLNNFKVHSITDRQYEEYYGFTDAEVQEALRYYHLEAYSDVVREWYDGYLFGQVRVYCPWDVINYCYDHRDNQDTRLENYWINTSSNSLVRRFVDKADRSTQMEIERLVEGGIVEKAIRQDLTYDEIDNSIENLWSVLFTTGYLTQDVYSTGDTFRLRIPNREVREVYVSQIQEWFKESVIKRERPMLVLCKALLDGDAATVERELVAILGKSISILDTKARDEQKENFYHGLMIGLLRSNAEWGVQSNVESGDGFCDILVEPEDPDTGIIIELKYARTVAAMDDACSAALAQIREKRYNARLLEDGRVHVLSYGIAFYKKRCRVMVER